MHHSKKTIIEKIFSLQGADRFWKKLSENDKYYPDYMHYVPNFKATLWTLILLAELGLDRLDPRVPEMVIQPLNALKEHFFDAEHGIYTLQKDHFPIPCLNGNMLYLDCYFNGAPDERSLRLLDFFSRYQRFDDGVYISEKNIYCANTSCYGRHTCYWGVVKLLKGISFIPAVLRNTAARTLLERCIYFVLLHRVCYSSRRPDTLLAPKIDWLTFPNMYKSDMLEILWLLHREKVHSDAMQSALKLLSAKQQPDGTWLLEREVRNLTASIGCPNQPNPFIAERAGMVCG